MDIVNMKWLRTAIGIGLAVVNVYANGVTFKQMLVSAGLAAFGAVTHLTSRP
jgi:hypothetical protein